MLRPSNHRETAARSDRAWPGHRDRPGAPARPPFDPRAFCLASLAALAIVAVGEHIHASWTEGSWSLLIAGVLFPPLGIVHGAGVWLGLW